MFCSIRSAIFNNIFDRSVTDEHPHASFAACAASNASSISSAVERAIWHISLPSTGVVLVKYSPLTGATHLPPIKLSYFALNVTTEPSLPGFA